MDAPLDELARNLGFENFSSLCLMIKDGILICAAMGILYLAAGAAAILASLWKWFKKTRRKGSEVDDSRA